MAGIRLKGLDAAAHPSAAAVKAAGIEFVLFYLGGAFAPLASLVQSYLAEGLDVGALWEVAAQASLGGAHQGQIDGELTVERMRFYGAPAGAGGYCTVDFEPVGSQIGTVRSYVAMFASELRKAGYRPGVYGGEVTLENTHMLVDLTFQAAGWSNGVLYPANLRQALSQQVVGGVQIDSDEALTAAWGGWNAHGVVTGAVVAPKPEAPPSTPLEAAQRHVGMTNPAPLWERIWPAHPADAVDWCAIFVSSCFAEADKALPKMDESAVTSGFAYCPDAERWAKASRWWTETPEPGDIALFCWDGSGTAQHTGIVEVVHPGGVLGTIEGNTGSPVGVYREMRSGRVIVGFLRPGGVPATAPAPAAPSSSPVTSEVPMTIADISVTIDAGNREGTTVTDIDFDKVGAATALEGTGPFNPTCSLANAGGKAVVVVKLDAPAAQKADVEVRVLAGA